MKQVLWIVVSVIGLVLAAVLVAAQRSSSETIAVAPSLEDRLADGSVYNPSTQSFLRGHHRLESADRVDVAVGSTGAASLALKHAQEGLFLTVKRLPLDQLVPRLHYRAGHRPDAFDAYNLMLAEYARVSLSVPVGKPADSMAHFETDFSESVPWLLEDDYTFAPNASVRPVRFSVINNCLAPGLWELSASDRTGEIYHSWFSMPLDRYFDLIAQTNGVDNAFAAAAVAWNSTPVVLVLDRLRRLQGAESQTDGRLIEDADIGFSSQDSRRKLHKHFVQVFEDGAWTTPTRLDQLTTRRCRFSNFVAPGKYSITQRREFDLGFLRRLRSVGVSRVLPLTHYNPLAVDAQPDSSSGESLELRLDLGEYAILIGNLPLTLLVPQEDFVINGFGVGILPSSGIAERQRYLIDEGPPPSFAYLCKLDNDQLVGLNSHDYGIEQIFIRTHINDPDPWWEITVTSYERIVDIVKYRLAIPDTMHEELRQHAARYVSPLYRTYRDDNLR